MLKSGEQVFGLLDSEPTSPDRVRLTTSAGEVVLARSMIRKVDSEPRSTGLRRIAEEYIASRRWNDALRVLEKSAALEPVDSKTPELLAVVRKQISEEGFTRLKAQHALNAGRLQDAEKALTKKDFAKARQLLDFVAATSPPLELYKEWRRAAINTETAWGLDQEDKLNYTNAASHFKEVLRLDPNHAKALDHLLEIWSSDPSKAEEVIQGYIMKNKQNPGDLLVVKKLADLLYRKNDLAGALPYLAQLVDSGKFPNMGYEDKMKIAYSRLAAQAAAEKKYEWALEHYQSLIKRFPNEDLSTLYAYEYLAKLDQLKPEDYDGRIALAAELKAKGLDTRARTDLQYVLAKDPANAAALKLEQDYAKDDLKDLEEFYKNKQWTMVLALATRMKESYAKHQEVLDRVRELNVQAETELKRAKREIRDRAKELVQLGDSYRAEAYRYANQMKNKDRDPNVRVLNDRLEAIKFAQRGIDAYSQALKLDPSTAQMAQGDARNKIADMQQLYLGLTSPPEPLPAWRQSGWK